MVRTTAVIPGERILRSILVIRSEKAILDSDIAALYGVQTRALIQAVKRNLDRFPPDFMLQLSDREFAHLRSQFVTSSSWGGRRYAPYAFTEQGVAMLSSVLKSKRAVQVNIEIMRTFVRLRQVLATHKALARKIEAMEQKYDGQFKVVFEALRALMEPPKRTKKPIGFRAEHPA
ncbi:MAG: ORF6N domain-containing protein [Planctomycetota bacterium]